MADLEKLKSKYQAVLNTIQQQNVRLQNVHIENDKLLIRGEAPSQEAKNRVWDQIKLVDSNYSQDLIADISVAAGAQTQSVQQGGAGEQPRVQAAGAGGGSQETYVVQSGDTLSKIAQHYYGDSKQYMRIFDANRKVLQDPNKIYPGQRLVIPK